MRNIRDIEGRAMDRNERSGQGNHEQQPAPMSVSGLIALGMVCGTVGWVVWVIWS